MLTGLSFARPAGLLFAVISALFLTLPGQAQTNAKVSEPCRPVLATPKATYEARLTALGAQLAKQKREYERAGDTETALKKSLLEALRALEADILDVSFDLECFRTEWAAEPPMRGDGQWLEITTYYATNRTLAGPDQPAIYYGSAVADTLAFGRVAVTIPTQHTLGVLELPAGWKFWASPDPNVHFTIKDVTRLESAAALVEMRALLAKARSNSILLFVHGYRTTFVEAALRTAQLANDLRFPGAPMFFSWPTAGRAKAYGHDEEAAELSVGQLSKLLATLSAQPVTDIYVLAHSMGNRVTTKALADLVKSAKPTGKIREILLIAPDLNALLFRTEIVPELLRITRARRTIYASSGDIALRASVGFHGFRRVGETVGGVQVFSGFETVDASGVAPIWRAWGHSYVFDNPKILADIEDAIVWRRPYAERNLDRRGEAPDQYWSVR